MDGRPYRLMLSGIFTIATLSLSLSTGVSAAPLVDHRTDGARPVPINVIRASANAIVDASSKYTIKDFGAPPAGTYSASSIVAFNDSDEIVGTAKRGTVTDCVLYTGAAFISLSPSPSVTRCTPTGMNSLSAKTKTATVVGFIDYAFADGTVAFDAAASTTKLVNMTLFSGNVSSQLNAANEAGEAIGTTYYAPPGGFTGPPLVYTKAGSNLTLAQPTCTRRQAICSHQLVFTSCPFAGCDFDDKGDVETVPLFTGSVEDEILNITTGKCCTTTDEYLATSRHFISDYGDVVGEMIDFGIFDLIVNGADLGQPNQSEELSGCTSNPLSFSNKGNVLVVSDCYPGHENWTWDPTHGFVDIRNTLPTNSYSKIVPLGINDTGSILVELYPHGGPVHWGVLIPPVTSHAAAIRRFRSTGSRLKMP